jgi:hypothetical protein
MPAALRIRPAGLLGAPSRMRVAFCSVSLSFVHATYCPKLGDAVSQRTKSKHVISAVIPMEVRAASTSSAAAQCIRTMGLFGLFGLFGLLVFWGLIFRQKRLIFRTKKTNFLRPKSPIFKTKKTNF